jgi:hypothetical protein
MSKFVSLSGKEIRLRIDVAKYGLKSEEECRSKPQFRLGKLLQEIYSVSAIILEDFVIPETKLSLDFFMPQRRLAFEFQGEQHRKYNKFFHGDPKNFAAQKSRDDTKRQWCDLNRIKLVILEDPDITIIDLKSAIMKEQNGN